ncbi:MAG: hypothetical protein R2823_02915 [Acidimicrobiia bacterium]
MRRWVVLAVVVAMLAAACTRTSSVTTTTAQQGPGPTVENPASNPPPPPAEIAPVLRRPGVPGDLFSGIPTLLDTMTFAANPIVRVELWNANDLIESYEPGEPVTELHHIWEWTPQGAGFQGIVLRAYDTTGASATSLPLWTRIHEPPAELALQASVPAPMPAQRANNLIAPQPAIAIDAKTCIASVNLPAVQDATGILVNAAAFGSAGFVPLPPVGGDGGLVSIPLGASPVMLFVEPYDEAARNPGPPTLIEPPAECADSGWSGDLDFSDGLLHAAVDRAYLYVTTDGNTWDRVPQQEGAFVSKGPDGAFNFGPLPSTDTGTGPVIVEGWGWSDGTLVPLGRSQWQPSTDGATSGFGNAVEIADLGSVIPDSSLDWIIKSTPVRTGTICTYDPPAPTPTTTTNPINVVGSTAAPPTTAPSYIATLPEPCTNYLPGSYTNAFRWAPLAGGTGLTHGLVQVSTTPPPADPALNFPGMVLTQTVPLPQGESSTDFSVDLGPAIDPPATEVTSQDVWQTMTYKALPGLGNPTDSNAPTRSAAVAIDLLPLLPWLTTDTLWVRVVPFAGKQLVAGESNEVVIDLLREPPPPEPDSSQPASMSIQVRMTPPSLPNPSYSRCVRVVSNPFGSNNPAPYETPLWYIMRGEPVPTQGAFDKFYQWAEDQAFVYENGVKVHKGMVPGSTVCAGKLSPPSKQWWDYIGDAIGYVGWVWDQFVAVWEFAKDLTAELLATVTGCNTIVAATGKSDEDAKKLCKGWSKTAINGVLMYFGVPPTMPQFKGLAEIGKGELEAWLVKQAEAQGLFDNCSVLASECKKLAEDLVDKMLDEMQIAATKAVTQAATTGSQWILNIHPGIYVVPEPAGTMAPAMFEVTITRSADPSAPAPPALCTYTGQVFGQKSSYSWQNYGTGKWIQSQPVGGYVMLPESISIDLSGLAPGESRKTVLALDQIAKWYLPGQSPQLPKTPWNIDPKPWIFLTWTGEGATTLTTSLAGSAGCGWASQTHPVDGKYTEPWEIPYP